MKLWIVESSFVWFFEFLLLPITTFDWQMTFQCKTILALKQRQIKWNESAYTSFSFSFSFSASSSAWINDCSMNENDDKTIKRAAFWNEMKRNETKNGNMAGVWVNLWWWWCYVIFHRTKWSTISVPNLHRPAHQATDRLASLLAPSRPNQMVKRNALPSRTNISQAFITIHSHSLSFAIIIL